MIELELHQLDRRYEELRTTRRQREAKLRASLDHYAQQVPVVVVASEADGRYMQGWLVRGLGERVGLSIQELARRIDRGARRGSADDLVWLASWPSRLLVSHAAMKDSLPLARAKRQEA